MSRAVRSLVVAVLLVTLAGADSQRRTSWVDKLDENNWDRMLTGEWMVEFYAPWCPACKALEPIWESLAFQKKELSIDVGKVDVTDAPGLSGRFMVTALPTIYHVKDGVFRQYKSPRDKDSLINFLSRKTWMKVDPVPSWKSPTSIQMSLISQFFTISQVLRGIHTQLVENFGLPTWGGYLVFAIGTIVLGALVGLLIVCIIDFIHPPKDLSAKQQKKKKGGSSAADADASYEKLVAPNKDVLVDEDGSESEEKSESDKTDKESKSSTSSPNVRKRRSRKAD